MRLFPKSVAFMLGLLLCTLPVFPAVPCMEKHCAMDSGAACCQGMDMGEMAMQAPSAKILPQPTEGSFAPLCDCVGTSSEELTPQVMPESQKDVALAVPATDLASLLEDLAPSTPPGYRTPPLRVFSCNAQSVLCSFLI
jgi:hypothetical protein